ncbi:FixH [Gimesia panareensis]|uniref:FixH n=1 Tax=Gimesia panareensis TaxID=2527978 RepID=A0A518FIN7_9PLAN|nr:FixH family protein [Gimesia panareensis]QDV16212.1 FixH [Gimesia panareensis]
MSDSRPIDTEIDESAETLARWKWGGVILGFLGLQILLSGVAVFLATSDPSNVIVEGYYEQALSWDQQRARQAASDALGWKSSIDLGKPQGMLGERLLTIRLVDPAGQPVTGCHLDGEIFHHARGGDVFKLHFQEQDPGNYTAVAKLQRSGLWELSLKTDRDAQHFQETRQFKLKDSGEFQTVATSPANRAGDQPL